MVQQPLRLFFLVALSWSLFGCKKSPPPANSPFVGTWTWLQTREGINTLVDQSSGIMKRLTFTASGMCTITHNDSIASNVLLMVLSPYVIKADPVINTASYQVSSHPALPCDPDALPFLTIQNFGSYQYKIVSDTLFISWSPCLAPVINVYIKNP